MEWQSHEASGGAASPAHCRRTFPNGRVLISDGSDDRRDERPRVGDALPGGDETAFDKLVFRHQQRALNVAFQLLRDREDAMEVAQDAFVRVYRGISEFRGDSEFTTWLHQIVVNLARNKRRWWTRRGREKAVSLDGGLTTMDGDAKLQVAAADVPPDVAAVKKEFVQAVGEHLAQCRADSAKCWYCETLKT